VVDGADSLFAVLGLDVEDVDDGVVLAGRLVAYPVALLVQEFEPEHLQRRRGVVDAARPECHTVEAADGVLGENRVCRRRPRRLGRDEFDRDAVVVAEPDDGVAEAFHRLFDRHLELTGRRESLVPVVRTPLGDAQRHGAGLGLADAAHLARWYGKRSGASPGRRSPTRSTGGT